MKVQDYGIAMALNGTSFKTWLLDQLPVYINFSDEVVVYACPSSLYLNVNKMNTNTSYDKHSATYRRMYGYLHLHNKGINARHGYYRPLISTHVIEPNLLRIYVFGLLHLGVACITDTLKFEKYYYVRTSGYWQSYGTTTIQF